MHTVTQRQNIVNQIHLFDCVLTFYIPLLTVSYDIMYRHFVEIIIQYDNFSMLCSLQMLIGSPFCH